MRFLISKATLISSSRSLSINPIINIEILQNGLRVSHFSTSANSFHSSPSSSFPSRRHEEESRNVRVSVWWDFENCTLPASANVFKVAHSITAAVRASGIKGPVQITAFGDVLQLSRSNQEALSSTGINITHIPHGGKNSADRSLLVDLMYWVSQNPPPAHILLISGDRDFASILHRLRMNNYNILLASPESAPSVLCSAASIMWHWQALVKGENLTGKHFNQPPDGPYGSWYGHYKVPLEDPFAVPEQPSSSRVDEVSESNSDSKLRPIPKAVTRQIRHILTSYPNGINISELRADLGKSNVSIEKDLYGYKKFSRFLLAMPHILKIQSGVEGQLIVHSISPKLSEPLSASGMAAGCVNHNGKPDLRVTKNGEDSSRSKRVEDKLPLPPSEVNVKEPHTKVPEPQAKVPEPQTKVQEPPLFEKVNNVAVSASQLPPSEQCNSTSEAGLFKRIWRRWSSNGSKDPEESTASASGLSIENRKSEDKHIESTSQSDDKVASDSHSSQGDEAIIDDKVAEGSKSYDNKSSADRGFFSRIINWFKFGRSPNSEISRAEFSEKLNQMIVDSGKHELFSKESFWDDMEAFMDTPKGSVLVLQSRTREQLAKGLKKQGFLALRPLSENDLLRLVDLLISEKKWVGEFPSQTYPFKLTRSGRKNSSASGPKSSNGLRSIFMTESSESNSQEPPLPGEKRHQNLSHTGVSPPVTDRKSTGKPRSEILADCQKLVDEIVKEYPEGFNMGSFRKLFLERFGYTLDLQTLGYQKLATLLQIMPGVKIESNHIFPSANVSNSSDIANVDLTAGESNISRPVSNSDSDSSDSARKDDDLDSTWEELGPVSTTSPNRNGAESALNKKVCQSDHEYETILDDDSSDSEEETLPLRGSEGQAKPRINDEDSSLLQILDSWYSSKEGSNRKDGSENLDGMVDCSKNGQACSSSGVGTKSETSIPNPGRKQRPYKSYSFVSEELGDNKNKLIDGILGSLKKSGESRIQS